MYKYLFKTLDFFLYLKKHTKKHLFIYIIYTFINIENIELYIFEKKNFLNMKITVYKHEK